MFYIASDDGNFFSIDGNGRVIKSIPLGMDIEDVCMVGDDIAVMDESLRLIYILDKETFKVKETHSITYSGARNFSFESLTFLPTNNEYIIITEKMPSILFVLNNQFQVINQVTLKISNDISSATFYNGALWILSDEDHTLFKMNPDDFSVEKKWNIPVYNPEGICFDNDGSMRIVSDDMRSMYIFPNPDK